MPQFRTHQTVGQKEDVSELIELLANQKQPSFDEEAEGDWQTPRRTRQSAAQIVRHFDAMAKMHAFKGASHPDDWDEIEARYQQAKERLIQHLMQ